MRNDSPGQERCREIRIDWERKKKRADINTRVYTSLSPIRNRMSSSSSSSSSLSSPPPAPSLIDRVQGRTLSAHNEKAGVVDAPLIFNRKLTSTVEATSNYFKEIELQGLW